MAAGRTQWRQLAVIQHTSILLVAAATFYYLKPSSRESLSVSSIVLSHESSQLWHRHSPNHSCHLQVYLLHSSIRRTSWSSLFAVGRCAVVGDLYHCYLAAAVIDVSCRSHFKDNFFSKHFEWWQFLLRTAFNLSYVKHILLRSSFFASAIPFLLGVDRFLGQRKGFSRTTRCFSARRA